MITDILVATINEVLLTNKFEIKEFQLGKEPYKLLKEEIENKISGASVEIYSIKEFMGIPVKLHYNDDAIMYSLKFRKTDPITTIIPGIIALSSSIFLSSCGGKDTVYFCNMKDIIGLWILGIMSIIIMLVFLYVWVAGKINTWKWKRKRTR